MVKPVSGYQRIVIDGVTLQEGAINTEAKFKEVLHGISLAGKSLVDIGCNCGMMVKLATEKGAKAIGIDQDYSRIKNARQLFPGLTFMNISPFDLRNRYDIGVMTGFLHYIKDYDLLFKILSRKISAIACDVWLSKGDYLGYEAVSENRIVPTKRMFEFVVHSYYRDVKCLGRALNPGDNSHREIYQISKPIRSNMHGVLVYGEGGTGKTSYALTLKNRGYTHLELDLVCYSFIRYSVLPRIMSIKDLSRIYSTGDIISYVSYYRRIFEKWLSEELYKDVVVEGFDLNVKQMRKEFRDLLEIFGYSVEEVEVS